MESRILFQQNLRGKRVKRANMDPIQTTTFILMILSYLTNVISGASLGNVDLFNETFDAEDQHRTVLQNIQRNYADEFRNYEMADIENYLSGFMPLVKKEKTPIFTSKTFFGSDQFFGARERSKDSSHHQSWDPFRANRVIGSQPSYFDVPDDLFQQFVYSQNNHELKTNDDNASEFPRGLEDQSKNKDQFPFSDKGNESSRPGDDDADDEVEELSRPGVDDAEDEVEELSRPGDDDTEDEVDELSHPEDDEAEDEVDELLRPEDDDAEDEVDELSRPGDDDAEDEVDKLSNAGNDDAEYEVDELSHPINDKTEDEVDEVSDPVNDENQESEHSHQVSEDGKHEMDEFSHSTENAEDQENELSRLGDDIDDEESEISDLVDGENRENKHSHQVSDDGKDQADEFSETVDGAKDHVGEFSRFPDDAEDDLNRRSRPVVESIGQWNEITHPIDENIREVEKLIHLDDKTPSDFSKNQEDATFLLVDGNASESGVDELISEGDDIDYEFFPLDKPSPTKVIEVLRQLNMANTKRPFVNLRNDSGIVPLDKQNENESHFEKSDEHLEKVQILSESDLIDIVRKNFHNSTVTTEDFDISKADIDEFQGSGDLDDSFHNSLMDSSRESKSGRIIDVFPRVNSTAECTTPKGERGHCLSLTQCPLSEPLNNFNSFLKYVCLSRGVLIGICCPDNPVVEISDPGENSTGTSVTEFKQPVDGCGLNTNTRIVGGKVSLPHEWTWMVALLRRNRFFCGGVIINDWYILTAAHCVMGVKLKDLKVRLGEYNFNEKNEHQEDIPVSEIKRHALFVTLTFQHDIALLKLKRRIEYTKFIGSICLPNPKSGNYSNVNATVVGWGTEAFGGSASPVLRQVTVPVWDNDECDKTYRLERITNAFMCAGSPENGEDACQGDSGGPLMALNEEGRWEAIGVVSWGRRCGDPTFPGVYTRITSYLDWIAENAN